MAKPDAKKGKLAVPEAGQGGGLKHNPFGALRVDSAAALAPSPPPPVEADARPTASERAQAPKATRARVVLRRETKRRGGKTVVVVAGLRANAHLAESEIAALAQHVKQQLGCGGAVERVENDTELVLQGDHAARVAEILRARGFQVVGIGS
jgi:translation initiation factor 1